MMMESHFVVRIPGLKKQVLHWYLERQRHLVITLCWIWLAWSCDLNFPHSSWHRAVLCIGG